MATSTSHWLGRRRTPRVNRAGRSGTDFIARICNTGFTGPVRLGWVLQPTSLLYAGPGFSNMRVTDSPMFRKKVSKFADLLL